MENPALEVISGLTLRAMNYKEVVEILQKRFGSKPNTIALHMAALLKVDAIAFDSNLKCLQRLYSIYSMTLWNRRYAGSQVSRGDSKKLR